MLKKIILGVFLTGFIGVLVWGGVNRTLAKSNESEGHHANNQVAKGRKKKPAYHYKRKKPYHYKLSFFIFHHLKSRGKIPASLSFCLFFILKFILTGRYLQLSHKQK